MPTFDELEAHMGKAHAPAAETPAEAPAAKASAEAPAEAASENNNDYDGPFSPRTKAMIARICTGQVRPLTALLDSLMNRFVFQSPASPNTNQ